MRYIIFAVLLMLAAPLRADPLVAAGQPGAVLLMRHAIAPGGGDPEGFVLGDCGTQRNLSDEGRAQARAIGAQLRAAGLRFDAVLTSEWCRTTETAVLLDLGPVTPFAPVNSFFDNRQDGPRQTAETLAYLATLPPDARVLIVTHQVNITALTGVTPRSGETVVTRRDGDRLSVEGRLPPP
ncbi:MAG: histidine phosphatase family protein [Cypionkella sp.]|nr:histidine phosphatase family protein [Cypionkella sp.]